MTEIAQDASRPTSQSSGEPGTRRPFRWGVLLTVSVLIVSGVLLSALPGCAAVIPNRDAAGEPFVTVTGETLEGREITVPSDYLGKPLVLLVGYVQDAQFDLDRWLLGLTQLETPVRVLELPTIPGMIPGMISGTIDSGMRSGIPEEDWGIVVTLYGDQASKVVEQLGNEKPRNGRVVLVDAEGVVRWTHARGYSASKVKELDSAVRAMG